MRRSGWCGGCGPRSGHGCGRAARVRSTTAVTKAWAVPTDMPKSAAICASVLCRLKGDQAHESALVGRELTALVTRTGDDEHGYPLDQGMRQVECGRTGHQRGLGAVESRRRAPLSTARDPRELRVASCGSLACPMISGHSERAQWLEGTMRALGAYASTASPSCGHAADDPMALRQADVPSTWGDARSDDWVRVTGSGACGW